MHLEIEVKKHLQLKLCARNLEFFTVKMLKTALFNMVCLIIEMTGSTGLTH